jgi:hypothetical protein
MFFNLSYEFASKGIKIHTGNAEGIDNASTLGAASINPSLVSLYLPWRDYNSHLYKAFNGFNIIEEPTKEGIDSVLRYHPSRKSLTQAALKLHARNYGIIMEPKVDAVIALPNSSAYGGGTSQGIRIAVANKISMYNIRTPQGKQDLKKFLIELGILMVEQDFEDMTIKK